MRKSDIGLIGVVGLMAFAAIYFVGIEYQNELRLTEEEAMEKMAMNLKNLNPDETSCSELWKALETTESPILKQSIHDKLKEMDC